jgi:EmrB/QacA subfamily drug resistance transporter
MTSSEPSLDPRRWLALAAVLCATLLGVLDFLIVNIAVPSIRGSIGATDAEIQLTIAGYGLAYAVCLITGGRLGDIYGRKKLFMLGMTGFTFASALCGLAQTPLQLVAARVLQGLLASAMTPQVLSIIQVSFSPKEKGLAFAIMGAIVGVGSFIGNVFGGWLVGADLFGLGWRPIFFVNVPIGLCALVAAWFLVRESKAPNATSLDWTGVGLSASGLFLLIFPLAEGREQSWPWWAFASIALSFVVIGVFYRWEKALKESGGTPLVDTSLFEDRAFSAGLAAVLVLFGGLGSFALTLTLFLQSGFKVTPANSGIIFSPLPVAFLLSSLLTVRLAQRMGREFCNTDSA